MMLYKKPAILIVIFLHAILISSGQLIPEPDLPLNLVKESWPSYWVKIPGSSTFEHGIWLFRNQFRISNRHEEFIIHISADSRYKLYVNGRLIGLGPAKGDLDHWIFDTYDIAEYLISGENIVAVMVWNYGEYHPVSFISSGTRFLCQGNGPSEQVLNTPGQWRASNDPSVFPEPIDRQKIGGYIAVPPGDRFDCSLHPWGWTSPDFDDSGWQNPEKISRANPRGTSGNINHALVPRLIPAMKYLKGSDPVIRLIDKLAPPIAGTVIENIVVPPKSTMSILLDNRVLENSYPLVRFSEGKDTRVKITYSEALFDSNHHKGNRDSIAGKEMIGYSDIILPDGEANRFFSPLWFRTYRYALIEIETGNDSFLLQGFENYETGYPFEERGYFKSSDPGLESIWHTGWRTLLLCSGETYYDCPYYEQLQYIGDTRIQAMVSLYASGDDRLMRKAIIDFYNSILPEGLTQSRYPSDPQQVIPTYSLFWISMINDYLWNRPDYAFVFEFLVPIQNIISWFEKRIDFKSGMLGQIEFWPFVDWTEEWRGTSGVPPDALTGNSSIISLQFVLALQHASEIFNFYGYGDIGKSYSDRADEISAATEKLCWDENMGYMADSPLKESYSQHANALAVLTDAIPEDKQALVIDRASQSDELIKTTYYFSYYLFEAMIKAGLGHKYLERLGPWHQMIRSGLSTFAEKPDPTRSDCHAWSASPLLEFSRTVAGVRPGGYGFESVIIEPNPGTLKWIEAAVPHYLGDITLDLNFSGAGEAKGTITLPDNLSGIFIWNGSVMDLKSGKQNVKIKSIRK